MAYAVDHVTPQPLTHGVAVCMDAEHSKGSGSDCINHIAISNLHIFKIQEKTHRGH